MPLANGLTILKLLASSPRSLGITEIAQHCQLAKSSTHDLLGTLLQLGHVEKDSSTQRYTISAAVVSWFQMVCTHFAHSEEWAQLIERASHEYKATIHICRIAGQRSYVVGAYLRTGGFGLALGASVPVYASSAGKAIISCLPREEWSQFVPSGNLPRITRYTNTDRERFYRELETSSAEGVGWAVRENCAEACSVAAPIRAKSGQIINLAVALVYSPPDFYARDREELSRNVRALSKRMVDAAPWLMS